MTIPNKNSGLQVYLDAMASEGVYPSKRNLHRYLKHLFKTVDFEGARVLDIGGGNGLFSFYAGSCGAERVTCLEPTGAGSSPHTESTFSRLATHLGLSTRVQLCTETIQAFEPGAKTYDVVLMHHSINHIDESACIRLEYDQSARAVYQSMFRKLFLMCSPSAQLIVCDCSRQNVYAQLGVRNPFLPMIEWGKHQTPWVWISILSAVGFERPRVRWQAFNTLGPIGQIFLSNRAVAYFLTSLFTLTMVKSPIIQPWSVAN